jgi:signal transduction histidine kinase
LFLPMAVPPGRAFEVAAMSEHDPQPDTHDGSPPRSSILWQVAGPALITGAVLIATGLGSAWAIYRLQTNLASIQRESVASLLASLELERYTRQLRYHSLLYLSRPNKETAEAIEKDEAAFVEALGRARESANDEDEKTRLEEITVGFERYRDEMALLREQVDRSGPLTDFPSLAANHPIRHIVNLCHDLGQSNARELEETARDSRQVSGWSELALILLALGGPVGGLLAGYGAGRALERRIARLSVMVRDAVGRISADDSGRDEFTLQVARGEDLEDVDRDVQELVGRVEKVLLRLQKQGKEMRRAEQLAAAGQLAAGVAHEVRNPLTGMKILVEAAIRPNRPRTLTAEDLRVIHGEITRMEAIVQHFLDFARPPALSRSVADLREVVWPAIDLVRARARQQGVLLEADLPHDEVPTDIDAGQFRAVVVNLLLNGLDAMPGGGRLVVRVVTSTRTAQLEVEDSGAGVAPEMAGRLFQPFASTKPTGTGLGLSLSRRIVEEHGGRIEGGKASLGGARFVIELPLAGGGGACRAC